MDGTGANDPRYSANTGRAACQQRVAGGTFLLREGHIQQRMGDERACEGSGAMMRATDRAALKQTGIFIWPAERPKSDESTPFRAGGGWFYPDGALYPAG